MLLKLNYDCKHTVDSRWDLSSVVVSLISNSDQDKDHNNDREKKLESCGTRWYAESDLFTRVGGGEGWGRMMMMMMICTGYCVDGWSTPEGGKGEGGLDESSLELYMHETPSEALHTKHAHASRQQYIEPFVTTQRRCCCAFISHRWRITKSQADEKINKIEKRKKEGNKNLEKGSIMWNTLGSFSFI